MTVQRQVRWCAMSLLKIPFIIASAFSVHWSLTIPKPPSSEVVASTAFESFFGWVLDLRILGIVKVCYFSAQVVIRMD